LSAEGDHLRAVLVTEALKLDQLRADLPPRQVAAELTIETQGFPPDPVKAKVQLRGATLDEQSLLDLDIQGIWTGSGISGLDLKAKDGDSRISIEGELALEGESQLSAQIDLRPPLVKRLSGLIGEELSGRIQTTAQIHRASDGRLKIQGHALLDELIRSSKRSVPPVTTGQRLPSDALVVQKIRTDFSLTGLPAELSGKMTLDIDDAAFGEKQLDQARLSVSGNMRAFDLRLDAKGGVVPADRYGARKPEDAIDLALEAHVTRQATSTTILGKGKGQIQTQTIDFDLESTTIDDRGAIVTEGIDLSVAGQPLHIKGQLSPHGVSQGLTLQFGPINLSELPSLSSEKLPLVGVVSGKALLTGNTTLPILEFSVAGAGVGLKDKPTVDLDLLGSFDASEGVAALDLDVSSQAGVNAELGADLSFTSGPRYAQSLSEAEAELRLELRRLETTFLEPYLLPTTLPVVGRASSSLHISGSLARPKLEGHTEIALDRADLGQVQLEHEIRFDAGTLETSLRVSDQLGPFADLSANIILANAAAGVEQLGQEFARVLADGTWQVKLETQKRALRTLPFVELFTTPADLPPVTMGLSLDASHEPGQEPQAKLIALAEQSQGIELADCTGQDLRMALELRHDEKQNTAQLIGTQHGKKLLLLEAETELLLAPLLAGAQLVPAPVSLSLWTEQLELSSMPFVCDRAQGLLKARVVGRDILGKDPYLEADVSAQDFSLGSQHRLDLSLVAEASQKQVTTELKLKGRDQYRASWGHLAAQLPWTFSSGKIEVKDQAPLNVQLELSKIPIAALLPPKGSISYARGTLDAQLKSSGTIKDPALSGQLELSKVAFTSTAVAQPLRDINGRLRFSGRKVFIEDLEAHDQKGRLTLAGQVDLSNLDKITGTIDINADDFPLRQRGQVAAVTTFKARAESTVTPEETRDQLTIKELDTWFMSVAIWTGIDLSSHE